MSPLTSDEKSYLLWLARESLQAAVRGHPLPDPPEVPAALVIRAGAFVSLHRHQLLRGCVGFVAPVNCLYKTVMEAAKAAALDDTRFRPVSPEELDGLEIEISVLSGFREGKRDDIRVGVHGLMVSRGNARGLLLPQVAVERNWSALQFLNETCRKAGLPPGAWNHGAKIEVFTAEVFSQAR